MTANDVRIYREVLGMSQNKLAEALHLGPNGGRTVRRWESGQIQISGPASVALTLMVILKEVQHLGPAEDT